MGTLKKQKRGPKPVSGVARLETVFARVSEEERKSIEAAAKQAGMSVPDYLRARAIPERSE